MRRSSRGGALVAVAAAGLLVTARGHAGGSGSSTRGTSTATNVVRGGPPLLASGLRCTDGRWTIWAPVAHWAGPGARPVLWGVEQAPGAPARAWALILCAAVDRRGLELDSKLEHDGDVSRHWTTLRVGGQTFRLGAERRLDGSSHTIAADGAVVLRPEVPPLLDGHAFTPSGVFVVNGAGVTPLAGPALPAPSGGPDADPGPLTRAIMEALERDPVAARALRPTGS